MTPPKRNLDKEKMQVYEIAFAMLIKLILVVTGVVGFFIILNCIIDATDIENKLFFGALELILCGTTYKLYSHYFPSKKS